ncbi:MAG: hypothetical protein RL308_3173 [Bacteroidota bacterium]|jgi:hypothetical protein
MGSFSYSCQLSGLPITSGTQCYIVPMLPKKRYDTEYEIGSPMYCSNDGVNIFFQELSFPIRGKYNDYGGIENIVKDDNTLCLEEYFGLTIEQIVSVLCDNRKDIDGSDKYSDTNSIVDRNNAKHLLLMKCSLTWIHAEYYDKLFNNNIVDKYSDLNIGCDVVLKSLGFKFNKKVNKERFNLEYEKDGLKLYSDDRWMGDIQVYSLTDLKEYCLKHGVDIDISRYENKTYYEQIYETYIGVTDDITERHQGHEVSTIIRMLLSDDYLISGGVKDGKGELRLLKMRKEFFEEKGEDIYKEYTTIEEFDLKIEELNNKKYPPSVGSDILSLLYFKNIKKYGNNFLLDNIKKWHIVKHYFYYHGRYLYPIGISPQDGELKKVQLSFEIANNIANKIILKRNCEEGEYEFETDSEIEQYKTIQTSINDIKYLINSIYGNPNINVSAESIEKLLGLRKELKSLLND